MLLLVLIHFYWCWGGSGGSVVLRSHKEALFLQRFWGTMAGGQGHQTYAVLRAVSQKVPSTCKCPVRIHVVKRLFVTTRLNTAKNSKVSRHPCLAVSTVLWQCPLRPSLLMIIRGTKVKLYQVFLTTTEIIKFSFLDLLLRWIILINF